MIRKAGLPGLTLTILLLHAVRQALMELCSPLHSTMLMTKLHGWHDNVLDSCNQKLMGTWLVEKIHIIN